MKEGQNKMGLFITVFIFPVFRNFFRKLRCPLTFSITLGWIALLVDQHFVTEFARRQWLTSATQGPVLPLGILAYFFSIIVVFIGLFSFDRGCLTERIVNDKLVLIVVIFWQIWLKILYGVVGCLGVAVFRNFSSFFLTVLVGLLHSLVTSLRVFQIYSREFR